MSNIYYIINPTNQSMCNNITRNYNQINVPNYINTNNNLPIPINITTTSQIQSFSMYPNAIKSDLKYVSNSHITKNLNYVEANNNELHMQFIL